MTCSKCGNELNEGAKFCTKCGSKVKVKLNWLFITSIILMSVGTILRFFPFSRLSQLFPHYFISLFFSLSFFSGIILAFISLYKKKNEMTMILGIVACVLHLMMRSWIWRQWWWWLHGTNLQFISIVAPILIGATILAFILLYKRKHKTTLISGLAVISLSFVLDQNFLISSLIHLLFL